MLRFFIAYGAGDFAQGQYYQGWQFPNQWKDMEVPQRPDSGSLETFYRWIPNPERPTPDDWQFDGHDADNGYWVYP